LTHVKLLLEPYYHLVYIEANINSLKDRDPKGLYNAADQGEIKDLVGYSDINPYSFRLKPNFFASLFLISSPSIIRTL
jgi:adenylylsulfate kinase-like enzyme